MTTAYALADWTNFGLATAGTAATLAGLLFVAVSINLKRILEFPNLPARAGVLRQCHRDGIKAMIWTVNDDKASGRWLADPRVDVVVTDRPVHAAMLRDRLGHARYKS